jgi:hypothetical protein
MAPDYPGQPPKNSYSELCRFTGLCQVDPESANARSFANRYTGLTHPDWALWGTTYDEAEAGVVERLAAPTDDQPALSDPTSCTPDPHRRRRG